MSDKRKFSVSKFPVTLRVLGVCVAFVAFGAAIYYGVQTYFSDVTRLKASVNQPSAAGFSDDKSAIILNDLPEVNNNREMKSGDAVRISYDFISGPYNPAFKYDTNEHLLEKSIKIVPNVNGKWSMPTPNEIVFTPMSDWPSGTDFYVKIDSELFSSDVHPDTTKIHFETSPVAATVDSFDIYSAPDGQKSVIGVAVVSFNHQIQTNDFMDKISMNLDGKRIDFHVNFDRYKRTAIIKTKPLVVTNEPQSLRLKLNRIESADGHSKTQKITANATIAAQDNFFKISDLTTISADDRYGNPQQLILINLTAPANKNIRWGRYIDAYLLPTYANTDEQNNKDVHIWATDEITNDVIGKSEKLIIKPVEFVNPSGTYQYAFSYDVTDNVPRYIYVTVKPNFLSSNGFSIQNGLAKVLSVSYPKRSVKIAGDGVLLSMAGDKKLTVVARGGVDTAFVNLYKIEENEINHLITQTYNLFSGVEFKSSWSFDAYDMSVVFRKKIPFADKSMNRVNYAPLNLDEYLNRTHNDKTGIFIIKTGTTENDAEYGDARLIMLTDLGIIRKINLDKSSTLFVSHLGSGKPAQDVDISVLGRNGYPVWAGVTNSDGAIDIPNFAWDEYRNEKEPVAIVAKSGTDVSFIPYSNDMKQVAEYSKFDVGGTYASHTTPLDAFVFSDRGIYRPGETVVLGCVVENKNFSSVADIPVRVEITDSRGRVLVERKISLASDGMFDVVHKLDNGARLGQYKATVYSLNKQGRTQDTIGITTFDVQEFIPDTMKIMATIKDMPANGWMAPNTVIANVSLNNLYGTPATNRKVSGTAVLRPMDFTFDKYKEYKFTPNFTSDGVMSGKFTQTAQTFSFKPTDTRTDDNGNAQLEIHFDNDIPIGTYMLTLNVNGFEAGDGKSIQTVLQTRVSNLDTLVGYHCDSDLKYVKRNASRHVKLLAINNQGEPVTLSGLNMRLIKRENLISLIKDYNNNYKYQSVSHDEIISQSSVTVHRTGTDLSLDTTSGGTYFLQLVDENDNLLTNIEYFVAADENTELRQTSQAELQIKLNSGEYKPGEEIEVGITAPYAGSRLITIERDKVYAYKWFNAQTTSSVQKIKLPADFEGTGYVNVSFVRDINSRDIFTTPYTYAVAPFKTNIDNRKINIKIHTPDIVRDSKLITKYITDKDARVMVFAVNSGILQVANYALPDPIKHFFQKAALQVETHQILSLLLPEYNILTQVAKTGGGDFADSAFLDTPLTNPFGRKNLPPVVFYSGIIETKANKSETIVFNIPEYFNGSLRIYAIAANTGAIGSADAETKVQSPIMLSMTTPVFVAPNDTFNVNTIISNNLPDSGDLATVFSKVSTSDNLNITRLDDDVLTVPENTEKLWTFDVSVAPNPGVATLNISTDLLNQKHIRLASRRASNDISIRPTSGLTTNIKTGVLNTEQTTVKIGKQNMYSENFNGKLYVSKSSSVLTYPLMMFLKNYEFSCTEQMVSKTIPYVLMPSDKLIGTNYENSKNNISKTIQTLINRQNDDGSFGLWTSHTESSENISDETTAYITAYVMNFLTMARSAGFSVPQNMFGRGIDFLRTYAGQNTTSEKDANAKAFAIYVLSVNDYVTTSYIESLEEYLDENVKDWKNKLVASYIAASYKMLKQTDKANDLFEKYKTDGLGRFVYNSMFDNNVANDAIHTYLGVRYFDKTSLAPSLNIENYINGGDYDSFNSAAIIMSFVGGTSNKSNDMESISVFVDNTQQETDIDAGILISKFANDSTKLRIKCPNCNNDDKLFYTVVSQGFPRKTSPVSNGIDISRKYYDVNGDEINSGNIGDIVDVKITVRTRGATNTVSNAVITDLLPGGFVPVVDTLNGEMDFNEIREDRILIYAPLTRSPVTFSYRVQLSVAGKFAIPAITAHDMYNPGINAVGTSGQFTVSNATE